MAKMPDFEHEILDDLAKAGHGIAGLFPHHRQTPETPATQPVNLAAATAAARPKENPVSLATLENDLLGGYAAVKNEIGKFEQNLPAIVADVRSLAASPLGKLAVTAGEHLAAGILPPEALAIVESGAVDLYNKILGLYNPQGAQAPAAPPAAPAQ
jgi:hypothetical protein